MQVSRSAEETITRHAHRQHGVVTGRQLRDAGLTIAAVRHRLRTGRLQLLHRGVYEVRPFHSLHTREMAAVLACGSGAALSHESAGVLWKYRSPMGRAAPVDITVPGNRRPRRPGIQVHRFNMRPDEITTLASIPITTPARTLIDRSATAGAKELARAFARARREGHLDPAQLLKLCDRHTGRRGVAGLRSLVQANAHLNPSESEAENRLLEITRRGRLPDPRVNVKIGNYRVDCVWMEARLIVEVDGFAYHASRKQFERDRQRDAELVAAGYRVIRVTWKQLELEPEATLVRITQALGRT